MSGLTELWNMLFIKPMLNSLIVLYEYVFHNFGLAIVVFTLLVRLAMTPLTLKQIHASKAMTIIQPKLQELQKKFGKDRQKLSEETMKLYKAHGVNPLGCLGPMIIQMPILIALYTVILKGLAVTPEDLLSLSKYLYDWPIVHKLIPLKENFLWLNLGQPDPIYLLPILVGGSMWVQQKMTMMPGGDPKQASMNKMMLWMMPIMFGVFTLQFASGLAIFWVVSNSVGIATQYFVTGWGGLLPSTTTAVVAKAPPPAETRKRIENGEPREPGETRKPGIQREDRGRSNKTSAGETQRKKRRTGDNRTQKR
ncbi:MAG: YidC/Oxa1 family membrane protein insertase [Dehalococcoidia bacterium]|nr:YidC/Oxa1 family membrane protein insertase [Dehalococcoidia bacterium]